MEEASVVVTAATGTLGPVIAQLSNLLRRRGGEYRLRRRTRKDVKLIRSNLKSVHSILWVIWEREDRDTASKELRMEAWRLADDMNDAIDDFILSLNRSNDGKRFIQAKDQPSPFQDLKGRAVDVYERCRNKWKVEAAQTTIVSRLFRKKTTVDDSGLPKCHRVADPYVHKDISELVGMEEPRDKLIKHLVGEEESTQQLKMACIVGPAGVGKTTLARLVYDAIKHKFQARAFVSVISCPNMTEVLASILQQVASVDSTAVLLDGTQAATNKNQHLIGIISSFLKDKRYLVVIDDIWHSGEWETIKEYLLENYLGSSIVTTSRVNAITEKWCDDFDALVHQINWVDLDEFRSCTDKMIGMNGDMLGEGFDRDHPLVKMCLGMPLAVSCMFSALAKERERQEQQGLPLCIETRDLQDRIEEQVKRNGIQNTPEFEPLVESLKLDYNDLPHHMLNTCLLYCSIYPEDHRFEKDDLVRRWIAQGFVCKEEVAQYYFDELVTRRFFIANRVVSYYLHPMIRSYLRFKLREDNFITFSSDIPSSPMGRICIVDYWPASSDAGELDDLLGTDWHHIRSLVVFKDAEKIPYQHLEHLRVLDVQPDGRALENQHLKDMCGLLRLRHLRVSGNREGITEMPTEIARLQYLETLEVTETKITRLPAEIGDLKQLKTLDVSWNEELAELPSELGNLQHILETLCVRTANIREQVWEIIGTLKKLKTLDVSDSCELTGIPRVIGELQKLKNLNVSGTRITELPCQIGNLQQLQILNLGFVGTITKLPRDIGRLQHLEELDLYETNVRKIPKEIGGLKKLKTLYAEIGTLPFEAGQLPKLQGLPKCVKRAWQNRDLMSSLAGEILSLEKTCMIGDGGLVVGTKHIHIPQWIKEHFNNLRFLDIRICKLTERDLNILREMPCLGILKLRFEAVPRKPIAISGGGFAKLIFLTVDSRVPRITFQEGAMPSLERLMFHFQFYSGPPNTDPVGIKHLVGLDCVELKRTRWYGGDSPCISAIINVVREEVCEHPNRIDFIISVGGQPSIYERPKVAESSHGSNEASSSEVNQGEEDPSLALHL